MRIETLRVAGIRESVRAMRNPMNSWERSDSLGNRVGLKDAELSDRLAKAGPEHAKHLRMIMVWADIAAPRYWWMEADTYRAGVEKVSCSTMHKLTSRDLTAEDFEEDDDEVDLQDMERIVEFLNSYLRNYRSCKSRGEDDDAKRYWRALIHRLPQSYIQRRTVMFSYAALRNIYRQRTGHKLREWRTFLDWVETLPESWMITGRNVPGTEEESGC